MNYCEKCGNKIEPGATFCVACGNKLVNDVPVNNKDKNYISPEDNKKANTLGIISIILYFFGPLISYISLYLFDKLNMSGITRVVGSLSGLTGLAAFVLMIVIRVKYPQNLLGKVIMWIYIGFAVLAVVLIIAFIGLIVAFISNLG